MKSLSTAAGPVVVTTKSQKWNEATADLRSQQRQQRYKNIFKLGIAEVVMGIFCIIMGTLLLILQNEINPPGDGIWGRVLIVFNGGLGVVAGKKHSKGRLIDVHMAFSIIGFVAAVVIFSFSIIYIIIFSAAPVQYSEEGLWIAIALVIAGLVGIFLQIVSAVYCCLVKEGCCQGCCADSYLNVEQTSPLPVTSSRQLPGSETNLSRDYTYPPGYTPQKISPKLIFQQSPPQQPNQSHQQNLPVQQPQSPKTKSINDQPETMQPKLTVQPTQAQQPKLSVDQTYTLEPELLVQQTKMKQAKTFVQDSQQQKAKLIVEQIQPQPTLSEPVYLQPDDHQDNHQPIYDDIELLCQPNQSHKSNLAVQLLQ